MPLVLLGVSIILIVITYPILSGLISWVVSNPIPFAFMLIIIGGAWKILKDILYQSDDSGEYLLNEDGKKIFKKWSDIFGGFVAVIFLTCGGMYLIANKFF